MSFSTFDSFFNPLQVRHFSSSAQESDYLGNGALLVFLELTSMGIGVI